MSHKLWTIGPFQTIKPRCRDCAWCIYGPKFKWQQEQNRNPKILAYSSLDVLLCHMDIWASMLFLLFTNSKESQHFPCEFPMHLLNHLSVCLSFYLRPSSGTFHITHSRTCALRCFSVLILLSCSTFQIFLSYFCTSQHFVGWTG